MATSLPLQNQSLTPALALAIAWALLPALPAWSRGELIGQPYTDLYPAVWGLWWFVSEQPGLPLHTTLLGAPEGLPFYYSSPLRGWLATPILGILGLTTTWNLLLVVARAATVLCAFGAARAWGLGPAGALTAAAVYGAAPFFQGYAVEGIVEGTDGWALALWLWAVGRGRIGLGAVAFALTALSSWYMAATACLLAPFLGRVGLLSAAGGLTLSAPALVRVLGRLPRPGASRPRRARGDGQRAQPLRAGGDERPQPLRPDELGGCVGADLGPGRRAKQALGRRRVDALRCALVWAGAMV
jgi:hypothetical protein